MNTDSKKPKLQWPPQRIEITNNLDEDKEVKDICTFFSNDLSSKLNIPIAYTDVPWDARGNVIRSKESNLGNLTTDIMRKHFNTDIGMFNIY